MRKRHYMTLLVILLGVRGAIGQQDPMFTNYQFNSLVFNPGYAGSREHLTLNLIHRQQWAGFDGAPITQSLIAHTPLKNERVGVGLSLVNDKIGPSGVFNAAGSYAYRMIVGKKKNMKLAVGLQASVANWRANLLDLTIEQATDPSFQQNISRWLPNFGAGVYLSGKRFYAGFGCPKLLENDLREAKNEGVEFYGKTYRHWYTSVGGILPVNSDQVIFRPSLLFKSTGLLSGFRNGDEFKNIGAPTSLNVDASFFLRQMFWVGVTYRTALQTKKSSNDSADIWASWFLRNGLRIGASYDITLSKLQKAGGGSFEVMVGYEFDIKVKKVASPRYF